MLVVWSKRSSAREADSSITSAFGFDAANAAIARGFVNGITLGGVEPAAVRGLVIDGIKPSARAILADVAMSTIVRSSIPNSARGTLGIARCAVP